MPTTKSHDSLGRTRRVSQGGAGPKPLPSKDAPKAGEFDPRPPDHLEAHGLRFWDDAVECLLLMGFIDAADRIFLIHAAESFQLYKECHLDGSLEKAHTPWQGSHPHGKAFFDPLPIDAPDSSRKWFSTHARGIFIL